MAVGIDGLAAEETGRPAGGANPQAFLSQGGRLLHGNPETYRGRLHPGTLLLAALGLNVKGIGFRIVAAGKDPGMELDGRFAAIPRRRGGIAAAFPFRGGLLLRRFAQADAQLKKLLLFQPDINPGQAGFQGQAESAPARSAKGFGPDMGQGP